MSNSAVLNGSFTLATGTVRAVGTLASTITLTGANYVAQNQDITASGYIALNTSSLNDMRAAYFANNDASASIIIASDNAGSNRLMILQPDDAVYWTWSGSAGLTPLYATAVTPADNQKAVLEYIITEK